MAGGADGGDLEALLARAVAQGVIDLAQADALRALREAPPALPPPPDLDDEARRARQERRREEEAQREQDQRALREQRARDAREESEQRARRAEEKARQIGAHAALAGAAGDAGDDDWLRVVDDSDDEGEHFRREVLPLIYENVGWLVGTLLVLAGSVYGLREAWITFDAAGRWASVAGAAFIYHALFVIVAAVMARRSAVAGQFLAGIGACLLPIAYVAAAYLSAANPRLGVAGAALLSAGAAVTVAGVGRRFDVGRGLVPAMLPPALTLVAYPHLASASPVRFLLPLVALGATWLITLRETTRRSLGALVLVLYAALTSEIFALSSGAPDAAGAAGPVWRTGGALFGAWLGTYAAALGLALFGARRMQPSNETKRRALAIAVWLGFALTAGAGALAAIAALRANSPPRVSLLVALAATLAACWQARWLAARRHQAFHALLLLASAAGAVACRLALPGDAGRVWWTVVAFLPPALHLVGVRLAPAPAHARYVAVSFAAILGLCIWSFEVVRGGFYPITLLAGVCLAAGCHRQAVASASGHAGWHYLAAAVAALGLLLGCSAAPEPRLFGFAYVGLAAIYWVAAQAAARGRAGDAYSPLDDASLLLLVVAAFASLRALSINTAFVWSPQAGFRVAPPLLASATPLAAASLGLLLRSLRDRSALPSAAGAAGLTVAALSLVGARTLGAMTLVLGLLALAWEAIAAALTPKVRAPSLGRSVFGGIELPWSWTGAAAIGQGFALVVMPLAVGSAMCDVGWLVTRGDDRALAIMGGLAVAGTCLVAFATRAGATFGWRGQVGMLWGLAVAAALTAVTNRIGRPLPPAVVGRNLTVIGTGLWLAAVGITRAGAWLEDKLSAPAGHGRFYRHIPLAGVFALASLLVLDALLLGPIPLYRGFAVVPPTMLLGPALLLFLLRGSIGAVWTFRLCAPLVALGGALVGAQRHLLGPALVQPGAPNGAWLPAATPNLRAGLTAVARYGGWDAIAASYRGAVVGFAAVAFAFATLGLVSRRRQPALADWSWWAAAAVASFVCLLGLWLTTVPAALLVAVVGAGVAWRWRSLLVPATTMAIALVVHAFAQGQAAVALWPGAVLGALAVAAAAGVHVTLPEAPDRESHLLRGHATMATLACLGLLYGFARGWPNGALTQGWTVLANAFRAMGTWGSSPAPAVALALGAAACLVAAVSWNALVRRAETVTSTIAATTLAVLAASTWAVWSSRAPGVERLVVIGALAMAAALLLHVASAVLGERFEDLVHACRLTRDRILVLAGGFVALAAVTVKVPVWRYTPLAALAILGGISLLSLLALLVERKPRFVYFLGTALIGSYTLARAIGLLIVTPADDAVLLLVLDFLLVGVTVFTRRRGLDEIATATRRFAAVLPIGIAIVLPWQATTQAGLFSLGAGLFYGLLAWVERNRIMGTLGAVAANIAVLILLLSQGLRGFEMYLAPIGLCTLIIVHLFADEMAAEARGTLRFIGTGLTYAPAAIALVLQVGSAQNDYYSLGFAAACVIGIGAGVWLRVRAYLVLGFGFLALDLGTELVRASLRNQRLGFFALSFAGLTILSAMAAYTLQRDKIRRRFEHLRRALATWD